MRAGSAVGAAVAIAALAASAPPHRMPQRMPQRVPHDIPHHLSRQPELNDTDTEVSVDYAGNAVDHHKVVHHPKSTKHDLSHHKRMLPHKMSAWKRITDIFAQTFLGYAGADYDVSSSGDRDPDTESDEEAPQQNHKGSRLTAMASSALSAYLPKLWKKKKSRKKTRSMKTVAANRESQNAIVSSEVNNNNTLKEKYEKRFGNEELLVEDGVPIVQQIYKMAGRPDVLNNPLSSLRDIEMKVEASGRKLTFIQYVAMMEIMVLAVIAAGVFRSANLPVPLQLMAKA